MKKIANCNFTSIKHTVLSVFLKLPMLQYAIFLISTGGPYVVFLPDIYSAKYLLTLHSLHMPVNASGFEFSKLKGFLQPKF